MSWDSDQDHADYLGGPYVREACIDCGADVVQEAGDTGAVRCESCWDRRDVHTSALELRMAKADLYDAADIRRIAEAILSVDLTKVREVA
jgi:DNA-directed RNA polymerase subunit RPC12/RpoP